MKIRLALSIIILFHFSACFEMGSTDTSSTTPTADNLVEQWKNEISGKILRYYYSDSYYYETIKIALCPSGFGSYYRSTSGGGGEFNFNWHIENTPAGGPILYLNKDDNDPYSYNLVMQDGIIYLNKNKYLRLEELPNCN